MMNELKFESLNETKFKKLKRNELKLVMGGAAGSRSYWCVNSFYDGVYSSIRGISDSGEHEGYSGFIKNDGHSYGSSAADYMVG